MRPVLRKGYLVRKKRFLKGALKGVLEGYLIKWLRPKYASIIYSKQLFRQFLEFLANCQKYKKFLKSFIFWGLLLQYTKQGYLSKMSEGYNSVLLILFQWFIYWKYYETLAESTLRSTGINVPRWRSLYEANYLLLT